jgi:hypothetical protein
MPVRMVRCIVTGSSPDCLSTRDDTTSSAGGIPRRVSETARPRASANRVAIASGATKVAISPPILSAKCNSLLAGFMVSWRSSVIRCSGMFFAPATCWRLDDGLADGHRNSQSSFFFRRTGGSGEFAPWRPAGPGDLPPGRASSKIGDQSDVAGEGERVALRRADHAPVLGPVNEGMAAVGRGRHRLRSTFRKCAPAAYCAVCTG